jgi:hypothetical protein
MSALRNKARFKESLGHIFKAFEHRTNPNGPPAFIGAAYRDPLEHTTRRYVIDETLTGLGWNLDRLTREMVEEARVHDDTTIFLDYLGVNPERRTPLVIVEAKAWAKPFITSSEAASANLGRRNDQSTTSLIAKAIEHCKEGGAPANSPVLLEWAGWIEKLHQYVRSIHQQSGHKVKRVAITAGRWMVIFIDPFSALVEPGMVNTNHIRLFEDGEIIERSDEIYECLAQEILVDDPPEIIQPAQLSAYASGADVLRVYRALWVARAEAGAHFDSFPQINLYPAILVQRQDGVLIAVLDSRRERLSISHRYDDLGEHIAMAEQASNSLLDSVKRELGIALAPSPLNSFAGFPSGSRLNAAPIGPTSSEFLRSSARANEFLLLTGTESHYLLAQPVVQACSGHSWSDCHALRENQNDAPIMERRFKPASFFTTNEPHHCAHRQVHQRRDRRCQISPFEEFLCCRACTFQTICWTQQELAQLPCGVATTGVEGTDGSPTRYRRASFPPE